MLIEQFRLSNSPTCPLLLTRIVLEDMIHVLECASHCLRHNEESPDPGESTEDREKHIGTVAGVFDQGRSDEADDTIVQPAGTSRQGDTLGAERRGEYLCTMKLVL